MNSTMVCRDPQRKLAVQNATGWNGIDFLKVNPADRRVLWVHFIHELAPGALTAENLRIEGGESVRHVIPREGGVVVAPALPSPGAAGPVLQPHVLEVTLDRVGDASTYVLRLVRNAQSDAPPPGYDRLLSVIEFSFQQGSASDEDCAGGATVCASTQQPRPPLNYLARDYTTFRQLLLDRMAHTVPGWRERHPADVGMALVELLAYVADRIAYQQDAVATEAYLGTARLRTSVRRHARLVDYAMHDGCNARGFVQLRAAQGIDGRVVQRDADASGRRVPTQVLSRCAGATATALTVGSDEWQAALGGHPQVYELLHGVTLCAAHNEMAFYAWGARQCCLPRGATSATLRGHFPGLQVGDLLILGELRGPVSGKEIDADPARRHAVKLTAVRAFDDDDVSLRRVDPLGAAFLPAGGQAAEPVYVTEIEWHADDALPFALSLFNEAVTEEPLAVAWGNIVTVDHGQTVYSGELPAVPSDEAGRDWFAAVGGQPWSQPRIERRPARYRPRLPVAAVTQATPFDATAGPAAAAGCLIQQPGDTVAQVQLVERAGQGGGAAWTSVRDLLGCGAADRAFVVETETDGSAWLRFGDDNFGRRPKGKTEFDLWCRVGNGTAGNLGASRRWEESLLPHLASADPALTSSRGSGAGQTAVIAAVWNPLPMVGGVEPESIESVRQRAPYAYQQVLERAVTLADWEALAVTEDATIQKAGATKRWTGSWRTTFLTVDRHDGAEVDAGYEQALLDRLERFRMAGQDLEVTAPRYVPLQLHITLYTRPGHDPQAVRQAVAQLLSDAVLPDGRRGVFHPDHFSFGQPVYLSPIQAAVLAVEGVADLQVNAFCRWGRPETDARVQGVLRMRRLEIAQLAQQRGRPRRGELRLELGER